MNDHDFVLGGRHKLIPSVYAICDITTEGKVSYSGDTFIKIRSGKHDSSTAHTHHFDLTKLFDSGSIKRKPILIIETDGAQDEAPRFPKPLACAVSQFKRLNLDAIIHGVNAAGLSAFNPVERRMAPLSHDLSGVVLPHDKFGNHLDANGNTIDLELEMKNFYAAADVLAEIWSHTVINKHPVHCEVLKKGSDLKPEDLDEIWNAQHVHQHRYGYQIVKCLDQNCCKPFETNWLDFFPKRFLPPPAVYQYGPRGLEIVEPSVYFKTPKKYKFAALPQRLFANLVPKEALTGKNGKNRPMPFDTYCESMQEKIDDCVCNKCGSYWPSCAAKIRHQKSHKYISSDTTLEPTNVLDEFDSDTEEIPQAEQEECGPMPIFDNIQNHVVSPFVQLTDSINDDSD